MESGILNNWQKVQLKPLTLEQMAAPHYNYKGGRNLPAAAIPSGRYLYDEPKEKHTLRNHVLGAAVLAIIGYGLALKGKNINTEGNRTRELIKIHSKAYVKGVNNLGSWLKTKSIAIKNAIIKPKNIEKPAS